MPMIIQEYPKLQLLGDLTRPCRPIETENNNKADATHFSVVQIEQKEQFNAQAVNTKGRN